MRRNGERCRRVLAKVLVGDGNLGWVTPMVFVGQDEQAPRLRRPPQPAMLPDGEERQLQGEPPSRWHLACHRRCGAVYTVTRTRLIELDPSDRVVYLAETLATKAG